MPDKRICWECLRDAGVVGILIVIAVTTFSWLIGVVMLSDTSLGDFLRFAVSTPVAAGSVLGIVGGFVAIVIGALFNAWATRRRDDRLREQEARALADALQGELSAALASCQGFVAHVKSKVGKKYQKTWLDEEINAAGLAPRIMSIVFEGNVTKLGPLGIYIVRDVVVIYDMLRNYDRLARIEQVMTRGAAINIRIERADLLEKYEIPDIAGLIAILDAYAIGGYKAAIPVGIRETEARKKRRSQLGKELGIPPGPVAPPHPAPPDA